jgi:hypothetical protein
MQGFGISVLVVSAIMMAFEIGFEAPITWLAIISHEVHGRVHR